VVKSLQKILIEYTLKPTAKKKQNK